MSFWTGKYQRKTYMSEIQNDAQKDDLKKVRALLIGDEIAQLQTKLAEIQSNFQQLNNNVNQLNNNVNTYYKQQKSDFVENQTDQKIKFTAINETLVKIQDDLKKEVDRFNAFLSYIRKGVDEIKTFTK